MLHLMLTVMPCTVCNNSLNGLETVLLDCMKDRKCTMMNPVPACSVSIWAVCCVCTPVPVSNTQQRHTFLSLNDIRQPEACYVSLIQKANRLHQNRRLFFFFCLSCCYRPRRAWWTALSWQCTGLVQALIRAGWSVLEQDTECLTLWGSDPWPWTEWIREYELYNL